MPGRRRHGAQFIVLQPQYRQAGQRPAQQGRGGGLMVAVQQHRHPLRHTERQPVGCGALLPEAIPVVVHPLRVQPGPPLGGIEEHRRQVLVLNIEVIIVKTGHTGGGTGDQPIRHIPEEPAAALGGIRLPLRQHIAALQQGRQRGHSIFQTGKAAVKDFTQGFQFRAPRRVQPPAGAEKALGGPTPYDVRGQQRRSPKGEAESRAVRVRLWQ